MTRHLVLGVALVAACSTPAAPPSPGAAASSSALSAAPAPSSRGPRPLRGETRGGSPRRQDARWQRALAGDPLELRALAEAEGATGLLEGLEDGGDLFRAACDALPLAPDAELALGRLGEVALLDDPALSDAAVVTMHDIATAPPSRGEALDPDGVASAAEALLALATSPSLDPDRRAHAIAAARAFAERGALDPGSIPSDLDPAPEK